MAKHMEQTDSSYPLLNTWGTQKFQLPTAKHKGHRTHTDSKDPLLNTRSASVRVGPNPAQQLEGEDDNCEQNRLSPPKNKKQKQLYAQPF